MPSFGQKRREQEALRRVAAAINENEIAPLPPIYSVERRISCERDPVKWLKTYLPRVFTSEFSESQERFVRICWDTIQNDGSKSVEAYRGFGKTSILSALTLFSMCIGRFRHVYYITAAGGNATKQAANWFASALYEGYDKPIAEAKPLTQDYPEIVYPIQRRRGVANKPLLYEGEPTNIVISPERIQFPIIKGSPSSGSLLIFTSIGSALRGGNHTIRDDGNYRVAAALFDDVQTDADARSEKSVDAIFGSIVSSVSFLSGTTADGGKEPFVALNAITQNQPGDVAERIRTKLPEFNSTNIPFLRSTPEDFAPWRAYREFRFDVYQKYAEEPRETRKALNAYYLAHKEEIERDCVPDDPRKKTKDQLTAIQYALEKWCSSERSFWCELQNDAARGNQEEDGGLSPITVLRKLRIADPDAYRPKPLQRWQIPDETELLTAFVDAGEHYLNYEVVAWGADAKFSHVVDFGVWPEQNYPRTSKKSFRRDLQEVYRRGDRYDRLSDATFDLLKEIFGREYFDARGERYDVDAPTTRLGNARTPTGARLQFRKLAICGVDAGDGEMGPAIWDAISRFHRFDDGRFFGRAIPTYGTAAKSRLLRFYDLKPGEWRRAGLRASTCDWIENPAARRTELLANPAVPACLMYDANSYRTIANAGWRTPTERDGAATLFDWKEVEFLEMFAEHQCAEEIYAETELSGQTYKKWRMKTPRVSDNEFFDTHAGNEALRHYVGIETKIGKTPPPLTINWV